MSATNPSALQDVTAKLYVATKTSLSAEFLNDLSNAESLRAEIDALTFTRVASVTDLTLSINLQDNLVEVESDDNGILKTFTQPAVNISWNRYEVWDADVLEIVLWINQLAVSGSPNSVDYWFKLSSRTLPELIVKIVTDADDNNEVKTVYLYNAGISADIQQTFLDVTRTQDLPASPFEFQGKKWWFLLINDQRIAA